MLGYFLMSYFLKNNAHVLCNVNRKVPFNKMNMAIFNIILLV